MACFFAMAWIFIGIYIYRFLRNIFEESINDPEKKAQIFLNRFDFEIGKYKVYFVFYEKLKPYTKVVK